MAEFALVFFYNDYNAANNYYLMKDDMTTYYTGSNTSNAYFAVNKSRNCFYVSETNVIKRRSLTNGALEYTQFESVGNQKSCFVDANGYLWTIDAIVSNKIRKWSHDLQSRTDYTIKAGVLDDKIYEMIMSYDSQYIYLKGGTGANQNKKFAKLSVSDLTGDPIWEVLNTYECGLNQVAVDESGNLYVTGLAASGGRLLKLSSAAGSDLYSGAILGGWAIAYSNGKVFTGVMDGDGQSGDWKQLQSSDGTYVGDTVQRDRQFSANISLCGRYLYGGVWEDEFGGNYAAIYKFDIQDDWGNDENWLGYCQIAAQKHHFALGDPTGRHNFILTLYSQDQSGVNWDQKGGTGIVNSHITIVSDTDNDRIVKRSVEKSQDVFNIYDMKYILKQGSLGGGNDEYTYPRGVAISPDLKYAYVCDCWNHRIKKIDYDDLSYICKAGTHGSGNDNFSYPSGIAISPDGKYLIVTDTNNHRIKKIRCSDLGYEAVLGSYGTGNNNFNYPEGCVISPDGQYIYITDTKNHRIKKHLFSTLAYVSSAGSYGSGQGQYNNPRGIAVSPDGNYLYVTDTENHRVVKLLASNMSYKSECGGYGTGNGKFNKPYGCAIIEDGKFLVVVDYFNSRLQKFDADTLSYISKFGSSGSGDDQFSSVLFCDIGKDNYIVVTDSGNHRVKKHRLIFKYQDLIYQNKIGSSGTGNNNFDVPLKSEISADNKFILISDSGNNRLVIRNFDDLSYKVEKTMFIVACTVTVDNQYILVLDGIYGGKVKKYDLATITLQVSSTTTFNCARDLAVTPDGTHVLIADTGNDKIVKLLVSDLSFVAQLGSSGSGNDQFSGPEGIDISEDGIHFLVADTGNHRIVKRLVSNLSYVAKIGTSGTGDDNFSSPRDVTITCDNLFFLVADSDNDRIVRRSLIDMSYVSEIGTNGTGNDQFDTPSGIALTKIGLTRVQTISEPAANYFYNKLLKYLPDFITVNEILTSILRGFENVLLTAKKWINASTTYALKNYRYQGTRLDQGLIEKHIFNSDNETEREKQWLIENALEIHDMRGTKIGLRDNLIWMTEDEKLTIEEIDERQSGWWLDVNYPQADADLDPDPDASSSFLNCLDQIEIKLFDTNKKYSTAKLKDIINRYLIPAHVTAHVKTEPNLIWYIAVNDYGDNMDLSKQGVL